MPLHAIAWHQPSDSLYPRTQFISSGHWHTARTERVSKWTKPRRSVSESLSRHPRFAVVDAASKRTIYLRALISCSLLPSGFQTLLLFFLHGPISGVQRGPFPSTLCSFFFLVVANCHFQLATSTVTVARSYTSSYGFRHNLRSFDGCSDARGNRGPTCAVLAPPGFVPDKRPHACSSALHHAKCIHIRGYCAAGARHPVFPLRAPSVLPAYVFPVFVQLHVRTSLALALCVQRHESA